MTNMSFLEALILGISGAEIADDKPLPEVEHGCACCGDYPATKKCCGCKNDLCCSCSDDNVCPCCKNVTWDLT